MTTVLLDTNCLIDLSEKGERAAALTQIVSAFRAGQCQLVVAAITASENPRKGSPPKTWREFSDLLTRVDLRDVEVLKPMAYWDVTFWGQALWVGDDMLELESEIHAVLFPSIDMEDDSNGRRWRNTKCDVQVVWTAMWNGVDILITSDTRIISRCSKLATIRPIQVLAPADIKGLLGISPATPATPTKPVSQHRESEQEGTSLNIAARPAQRWIR